MHPKKCSLQLLVAGGLDPFRKFFGYLVEESNQPRSRAGDLAGLFVCLAIGLMVAYWPYYLDNRFYFNDDEQTQSYAYFLEIGQQLRHGHWPFLTLSILNGGNLILEWQWALFNPISLLSYWLIASIRDLSVIGLMLASFYITSISLGGYVLARSFGIGRVLSVVAGTVLCTNNFIIFIYSHGWMPGLVASSWFLWVWSFIQFYRSTGETRYLVLAVIFGYLTLSAGWPNTILMLGILVAGYLAEMSLDPRGSWSRFIGLAFSMAGLLMVLSPVFLPAILSRTWTIRGMDFFSHGLFMINLGDFLNLSTFDLMPRMTVFNSSICSVPITYLAWFIVPLFPFLRWNTGVETLARRWALGFCGVVSLILLFGPEATGPIRWPFRYLPLAQTVALVSFLLLINKTEVFVVTVRRSIVCAAIVILSLCSSISAFPRMLQSHVFSACLLGFLSWIAVELIQARAFRVLYLWLTFGVIVGYAGTHMLFKNVFLPDLGTNPELSYSTPSSKKTFEGYTLCLSGEFKPNQANWSNEAFIGDQGIYKGEHTINGYSSVEQRTFDKTVCAGLRTAITSAQGIANLFSTETTTGLSMAELLRVNTLIIEKENVLPIARPYLGSAWKETSVGLYTVRYDRKIPNFNSTTLAWTTPGIDVVSQDKPTGESEALHVSAAPTGGTLVFARLWWPGYAATLNGSPVMAKPFNNLLVGVQLPPQAQGRLLLTYVPPGYRFGLILSFLGLIIIAMTVYLNLTSGRLAGSHDLC